MERNPQYIIETVLTPKDCPPVTLTGNKLNTLEEAQGYIANTMLGLDSFDDVSIELETVLGEIIMHNRIEVIVQNVINHWHFKIKKVLGDPYKYN